MSLASRYAINNAKITHQTIDGEVVIVNLANGNYYSLQGSGAAIWTLLEQGLAASDVIDKFYTDYEGSPEEIAKGVNALLEELQKEELVIPGKSGPSGRVQTKSRASVSEKDDRPKFELPMLAKFTDMQDLLLLDPIHDVDEAGWPTKPRDGEEEKKA